MTVVYFGPLTCSIVTTTRKFFTILGSVILFGNVMSTMQWVGTILVFLGESSFWFSILFVNACTSLSLFPPAFTQQSHIFLINAVYHCTTDDRLAIRLQKHGCFLMFLLVKLVIRKHNSSFAAEPFSLSLLTSFVLSL